jgi:hypothetical protein
LNLLEKPVIRHIIAVALALTLTGCASFIEKNARLFPGDETRYSRLCTPAEVTPRPAPPGNC